MTVNMDLDGLRSDSEALRREVSFLGALLGEVLREQGGDALFDTVETARIAARARRDGDEEADGRLHDRSIRLKNPYVDPISLLQVDLLERWRAGGSKDADLERALRSTVRGIARGMQNTG